jgi:hypothetical protein
MLDWIQLSSSLGSSSSKSILRTPVRHCELNPIELIWAQVKGFVAENNTTFRLKDVEKLVYGGLVWHNSFFSLDVVITGII